jgi:phage terminase large subunit GpA-like protein
VSHIGTLQAGALQTSREGLLAFDQAMLAACALMRPPEKLTCAEWADKYGMLPAEAAAMPGKYFISNAEYQREPLQVLSDSRFQTEVLMWSSQVGKTQLGLFASGYYAEHDPCPQLLVQPTESMAKTLSKDRIEPTIRDTPILRPIFHGVKGEALHKLFPGGHLTIGWATSPAELAMRPVRFLWTDEEGRYGPNAEGNAVDQARKRTATFKANRKHLRTSSPALRKTCLITHAYEHSDQRHFYVPCPDCGHMQTLAWERMGWLRASSEPGNYALTDCWYACEACDHHIRDQDKYAMVTRGEWRAHNPGGGDGRTAGFHLSALYSTIGFDWDELVAEYLKCEGIPDKLQVFTNTLLGLPWDEQAEGADTNAVARHAEEYTAPAPAGVLMVTCGADVQKDRIEATKVGWGLNEQAWVIEHGVFYGDTRIWNQGAWAEFDAWRRLRVEHELGLLLPVCCTFVDSGDGNRTEVVYQYCRMREAAKVYASKGSSQTGAPLVAEAKRVGRNHTLLVLVGASTAKDALFGRFLIDDPNRAGYIHFPLALEARCTPEYFAHLTSEALVTKRSGAREVSRWEKKSANARNEALDCLVYAFAGKAFTRAPLKDLARRLLEKAARLKAEGKLEWEPRAAAVPSSPSPASSAPSTSPAPKPSNPSKGRRKMLKRPGFGWIHGR